MKKFDYEGAPLVLAFVLGPLLENNLRKSLILSQGDFAIFVTRPLSGACLALALLLLVSPLLPAQGAIGSEVYASIGAMSSASACPGQIYGASV